MDIKQFVKQFHFSGIIGALLGLPIPLAYLGFIFAEDTGSLPLLFMVIIAAVLVLGIIAGIPVSALLIKRVWNFIDRVSTNKATKADAQKYFKQLLNLPFLQGAVLFLRLGIGSFFIYIYLYSNDYSLFISVSAGLALLYGAFIAGLIAFALAGNAIAVPARKVVKSRLLERGFISRYNFFSLPAAKKTAIILVPPILFCHLVLFFYWYHAQTYSLGFDTLLISLSGIMILNVLSLTGGALFISLITIKPLKTLIRSLAAFTSDSGSLEASVPTDLSDEYSYIGYLINQAVDRFEEILSKIKKTGEQLGRSIQELNVSSQEISSTSNQQAASVKEIVSTMEDSDALAKSISNKIKEVTKIANKTTEVVEEGFSIIKEMLTKMDEIKQSNSDTISGIQLLGEKIENIWDIVNIINGIADQTKIIAFNAELEAASAGEAGKNFRIVASEIRRLADSTVTSTNEIKSKITEIQHSSDNLIIASEEGTEKISAGWELSNDLQKVFEDVLSSAEISAHSAGQIELSIDQQASAFEQILLTLRQISEGIDNFVTSTKSTSKSSAMLMEMSKELHQIVEKYVVE